MYAQDRIIKLDGGHNFRDLGGYPTEDGRQIAWGRLFRSGLVGTLSATDQERLDPLEIRVILDLRATGERSKRPTRWGGHFPPEIWFRDYPESNGELLEILGNSAATAREVRMVMSAIYCKFPIEQKDSYRELFRRAKTGSLPMLFHCTAGKDRTGVAAALLLTALGVGREIIIADYLVSSEFFDQLVDMARQEAGAHLVTDDLREKWEPLFRTDRSYLEAMFTYLENNYGSVQSYLQKELGADPQSIRQIRDNLLI